MVKYRKLNIKKVGPYSLRPGFVGTESITCQYSTEYPDRLISYNGQAITYDSNGNVATIGDNIRLNWNRNKQLSTYTIDGYPCVYTYNADGVRISKATRYFTIDYVLDGDRIVSERICGSSSFGTKIVNYIYSNNELIGFQCDNVGYLFIKNLQNDIIGIVNESGEIVARYVYDAWGNHKVCNQDGTENTSSLFVGNINPFRYRVYYYDRETGLFMVGHRYYNPEWGRWLSPDDIEYLDPQSINGLNLYAYCNNDPVNKYDPTGHFPWLILAAALLFTPIGGIALQVTTSVVSYAGMAVASIFDADIRNDMNRIGWNPFNSNEDATLASDKVSFYKGVPVFRTTDGRSGSFGAIFLRDGADETSLRHERGHNWQLMMMGIGTYLFTVGIPSPLKLGSWAKNEQYHYAPWEAMADILGGVKVRYGKPIPETHIISAWNYYALSMICFPLTALYWFG